MKIYPPVAEVHFVAGTGTFDFEAAGSYFAAGNYSAAGRYSVAGSYSAAVGRYSAAGSYSAAGTGFAVYFYLTAVVLTLLIFSPPVLQLSKHKNIFKQAT